MYIFTFLIYFCEEFYKKLL